MDVNQNGGYWPSWRSEAERDTFSVSFIILEWMHTHAEALHVLGAEILSDAAQHASTALVSLRLDVLSMRRVGL